MIYAKKELIEEILNHPNYSQEKIFKIKFPDNYAVLSEISFPENFLFKQKLYHYLYDDYDFNLGKCPVCGNRTKYRSFSFGYIEYCSIKCAENSEKIKNKISETNIKKYGNKCSLNGESISLKKKKTWITKYGTDNPAKSKIIQEKIKHTNLEKYGCEYPLQNSSVQNKLKKTNKIRYNTEYPLQNTNIKNKSKNTCRIKYGTDTYSQTDECKFKVRKSVYKHYGVFSPMQSDKIKEKTKNTCILKYGVEYVMQNNAVKNKFQHTCMLKYGVNSVFAAEPVKEKIKQTNIKKYGVPYYCMKPEIRNHTNNSKPNREFAKLLGLKHIEYVREFHIESYSYDFKINNTLIEINPTITHNSYLNIFGDKPIDKDYHIKKTETARKYGFECIHIWDWDDIDKVLNIIKHKEKLYARKLVLKEISENECNCFLNEHHLQNTCFGQTIRYGLYKDDTLVQLMTFGKPRYNKNYELELLRLCSHKDYIIIGGTEKIFKYILNKFNPKSIISYCDNSKFSGNVYSKLGFTKKQCTPSKHWFRKKDSRHITDNLLRQRGFDQIFGTNYGKGTLNEELMIKYKFLPVFDCGQTTWVLNFS